MIANHFGRIVGREVSYRKRICNGFLKFLKKYKSGFCFWSSFSVSGDTGNWGIKATIHSHLAAASVVLQSLSDSAPSWTVAHQAPLSTGFPRQEYRSELPCPPPGDLPHPGIKATSPSLVSRLRNTAEPPGKPEWQQTQLLILGAKASGLPMICSGMLNHWNLELPLLGWFPVQRLHFKWDPVQHPGCAEVHAGEGSDQQSTHNRWWVRPVCLASGGWAHSDGRCCLGHFQLLVLQKSSTAWNLFPTVLPSPGCFMILRVPYQGRCFVPGNWIRSF